MDGVNQGSAGELAGRARQALQRRDAAEALALLRQAEALAPSLEICLDKALALRMTGDMAGAVEALDTALVFDPLNLLALLSKGALLQRLGREVEAVSAYKAAIAVAPPIEGLPAALAAPLATAKAAVAAAADALAAHFETSLAELRRKYAGEPLDRFDEAVEIFAGRTQAFVQQPLLLPIPRLPAIPFHDRAHFPWLGELEAASQSIAEEFTAVRERRVGRFVPYIDYPPGVPVNQWGELNHSAKWSTFFLWLNGVRQDEACALCPRTAALLAALPMADLPGHAPTAMFSVLDAHTRIPTHTGSTNARLIVHLPLVLPGPARFRVGNVTREWRMGQAWVFDDTIEHEAWNDADTPRTLLIFDVWNPLLSEAERVLISALLVARRGFNADG